MLCITNLRESVCPGLLHRQFVLCVNISLFSLSMAKLDNYLQLTNDEVGKLLRNDD